MIDTDKSIGASLSQASSDLKSLIKGPCLHRKDSKGLGLYIIRDAETRAIFISKLRMAVNCGFGVLLC